MAAASPATQRSWLRALTDLPTASGKEHSVQKWVRRWAGARGLHVFEDRAGNLLVRSAKRSRRRPLVAVAHMDHPALVVKSIAPQVEAELRGGVASEYLAGARLRIETKSGPIPARVEGLDSEVVVLGGRLDGVGPGDIARWHFAESALGVGGDRLRARACDDLAGAAASLSALDRLVASGLSHFSVLLTRAEEVGFVGAIAACELKTLALGTRVLSIECSRQSVDAPVGGGPIVRVGDASSVFSAELTNRVTEVVRSTGLPHLRKLMSGGSCEATAFAAFGYESTGLCLALDNYHNMVDLDGVRSGKRRARLAPEEISLSDFSGLVNLLEALAVGLDSRKPTLPRRLRALYRDGRKILV
ncbi:MAG: M20/M25/M40 family metallo-hydrolase [Acidimicrobiia bacterium]